MFLLNGLSNKEAKMKYIILLLLTFHSSLVVANEDIDTNQTYYTLHSFRHEKGRHLTTNYQRGAFVPVNTKVKILAFDEDEIILKLLKSDQEVAIVNVFKYSQASTKQIFKRMFSKKKTTLGKISKKMKKNIKWGIAKTGMSKKQVLIALGYPPGHQTPSTEMDQWRYWKNRFNTMMLYFDDGKLSRIKD